mmetsp:Transcript_29010/g.52836  ORF Transcript_29010/g.52836 Transcript_29010/m.52836 type:complete len:632 (+) Transcript_29010:56-1951(+)
MEDAPVARDPARDAVRAFGQGNFIIVVDEESSSNPCNLLVLGESITVPQMAFLTRHSTGIVCVALDKKRAIDLGLSPVTDQSTDRSSCDFYTPTDFLPGTTSGMSASDRAATVKALANSANRANDFSKPGHVFPICPREGGVLERKGLAEAAHDLCRLAGKQTVVACAALMRPDGEMVSVEECSAFSNLHSAPVVSMAELAEFVAFARGANVPRPQVASQPPPNDWDRQGSPSSVELNQDTVNDSLSDIYACSTCTIPVRCNNFKKGMNLQIFEFADPLPIQVVAAIKGDVDGKEDVAVRIHSECFTGDVLRSAKCDCGLQLEKFFTVMESEPCAVLLYVKGHEGRGIGLAAKLHAYRLQSEENLDTVDSNTRLGYKPDLRSYKGIVSIFQTLGIKSVKVYSNNKEKIEAVRQVLPATRAPLKTVALKTNRNYLITKEERMEHMETMVSDDEGGHTQAHTIREEDEEEESEATPKAPVQTPTAPIEWPRFGDYAGFRVALVSTSWNPECARQLVQGCENVLLAAKCSVSVVEVPGALDLVAGCKKVAEGDDRPNVIVALGTYVRGDTETSQMHYQATVNGIQELNVVSTVPVVSGVVFCNTKDDAVRRCTAELGGQWAKNALQMISVATPA